MWRKVGTAVALLVGMASGLVAWHVGIPPLMFWAILAMIGAAVAIVRVTFLR